MHLWANGFGYNWCSIQNCLDSFEYNHLPKLLVVFLGQFIFHMDHTNECIHTTISQTSGIGWCTIASSLSNGNEKSKAKRGSKRELHCKELEESKDEDERIG